jgi:hypothetical protein
MEEFITKQKRLDCSFRNESISMVIKKLVLKSWNELSKFLTMASKIFEHILRKKQLRSFSMIYEGACFSFLYLSILWLWKGLYMFLKKVGWEVILRLTYLVIYFDSKTLNPFFFNLINNFIQAIIHFWNQSNDIGFYSIWH